MRPEFQVHMMSTVGTQKARRLAEAFSALLDEVEKITPEGRELALVKTHLETASFFAKRGMAKYKDNHES